VSYRDRQRLADIRAATDAIRSHLQRGTLADSLVLDAVRRGTHLRHSERACRSAGRFVGGPVSPFAFR
jgi:hypothetical protein